MTTLHHHDEHVLRRHSPLRTALQVVAVSTIFAVFAIAAVFWIQGA